MAWRSSGANNDELVDNLRRHGIISSQSVEKALRAVDRKFFVPKGNEDVAHSDQPLKVGNIHISAPHVYGTALQALELQKGSPLSFLNIGSGTGYLMAIVSEIIGPTSLNFGVEIHSDVIDHCHSALEEWHNAKINSELARPHFEIVLGNGLCISANIGESIAGFDRIYVGAAIEREDLIKLVQLLSPGGILVSPVNDQLVKVIRAGERQTEHQVRRSQDDNSDDISDDNDYQYLGEEFTMEVLSGVCFASLLRTPALETKIDAKVWNPESHCLFPQAFRKASLELLMCSNSKFIQPLPLAPEARHRINVAAVLPKALWMEVLSFTHRKWFAEEQNEVDYLKKRVAEEQAHARRTHRALIDTEQRLLSVERERDVFRMLARRWQSRLQQVVEEQRQRSSSAISTTMNVPTLLEGELLADDIDGESSYNSDGSSSAGEDDEFMEEETAPDAQSMNIDEADHLSTGDDETNENSDEYFSLGGIASGRDGGRQGSNSVLMGDVDSDSDDEDAPRGNNLITGVEVLIDSAQKARAVSMSSDDL